MADAEILVGCCGWTKAQARYVADFPVIELQSTFYQPPALRVAQRWRSLAPAGFRFSMKAWQLITHTPASPTYRRLKSAIAASERDCYGSFQPTEQVWLAWERTRELADVLEAEVVVFQCPKSFLPTRHNTRNLSLFFQQVDRGNRLFAWEPRGEEWRRELVRDLCAENNLLHCVDPFECSPASDGPLYWRLHGKTGYRYRYTDEDLAELAEMLRERAHGPGPHYVMFNNIYSKQDAARFQQRQSRADS